MERVGNAVAMVVFVIAVVYVVVAMLTKYTRLAIIVHDRSVVVSTINLTIFVLTDALVYGSRKNVTKKKSHTFSRTKRASLQYFNRYRLLLKDIHYSIFYCTFF